MKVKKNIILIIVFSVFLISCSNDDGSSDPETTDLNFSNGNLTTGAKTSKGTSAPEGYTWSEIDTKNYASGIISNNRYFADDFVVPNGEKWTIEKINIYAFYGGYTGVISPFDNIRYEIYDADPSLVSSTKIYGDINTNKYVSAEDAKMYRIFNGEAETIRKIFRITANATDLQLSAGTYWIKWQISENSSAVLYPSNITPGTPGLASYNAKAKSAEGNWGTIINGDGDAKVDFPFELIGRKNR